MVSLCACLATLTWRLPAGASGPPGWLPRYDLQIKLDTGERVATVRQRVIWTHRHSRPTRELVFNVHAHYSIPDKDIGLLAKTVELLRMAPGETLSFAGPTLEVAKVNVTWGAPSPVLRISNPSQVALASKDGSEIRATTEQKPQRGFEYQKDNPTALVVPLPREVYQGETVTADLEFTVRIPNKKARWGQWDGVTTLAQWLPVLAYYDEKGWQPTPFVPWHQPFFNEAGVYTAAITLPADQKLACTGQVESTRDLGNGWRQHRVAATPARDFALICSARFEEHTGQAGQVRIRCLALPEHRYYGEELVKIAAEAIPAYSRWFGAFPYPQFTLVEAYFGFNGNECGDLVMIDERIMGLPTAARNYVDYLVSHEICHQWWYNVVGTNGYAETWMDEGLATYFSHRLITRKQGKNNELLTFPSGLGWLPNIHRDDFRNYSLLGVVGRGQAKPTVGNMESFGHLANLSAMTYDRGSRIVGMIEERLGEAAFFDFMRRLYDKYGFQVLRVADYQKELEAYTRQSWEEFFRNWLYGTGMCDWAVDRVEIVAGPRRTFLAKLRGHHKPVEAVIHLSQRGPCNEPVTLGIRLDDGEGYPIRLPIFASAAVEDIPDLAAHVETTNDHGKTRAVVHITLPSPPTQVSVDPDGVLLDSNPDNNHWKRQIRWRLTPLFTPLEEVDVTNAYDRWNIILGPWVYTASYNDPWYTRSSMAGVRAAVFRTQFFDAGAYLGFRTDDRNLMAGVDALLDHFPWPQTQLGFNIEQRLATFGTNDVPYSRGVLYGRYIMTPGSSLYLPPFEYAEVFGSAQNRGLPEPRYPEPGDRFDERIALGVHYHKNFLTPYWDPEGGVALDATYEGGLPIGGAQRGFHQAFGQVSWVKSFPDPFGILKDTPGLSWLTQTRLAFRMLGAAALPSDGLFFTLGGGDHFRGFDLSERQGSVGWTGSVEWRVPVIRDVEWDCLDHFIGMRNAYIAPFYDVGDMYLNGRSLGPVAHALGVGFRLDIAWLGLIERTMLRFDVAQTIGTNTPVQFWFGLQHPF